MRRSMLMAALLLLPSLGPATPAAASPEETAQKRAARLAEEGEEAYRRGAYSEALRKFEAAMSAGLESPAVLYQAANCHRVVMSDTARELELKKKAIPLLEDEVSSGRAGIDSHYYLAAIYIHSLSDPVKGVEVARKGVALVEKKDPQLRKPVENLYRAARLYEFLGKDEESAEMDAEFLGAAEVSPVPVDRASVRISREKLASHRMRGGRFREAAELYRALVKADPVKDALRHQWGLALLRAGDPEGAAVAWRGAAGDEYRTELAYLEKVALKYAKAGKPDSSKTYPEVSSMSDQDLATKIVEAGAELRKHRQKAESEAKARNEDRHAEERAKREAILVLSPEERRARWEARKKEMERSGKPLPGQEKDGPEASEGRKDAARPGEGLLQRSEAWEAAERDFIYLMTEFVRRGHLIRMYCFQNGISDLVFR